MLKRIPYDSLVLATIVRDLQPYVGGKVQEIRQRDAFTIQLELYRREVARLLVCVHPEWYRVHLSHGRIPTETPPPMFLAALRARLDGATITGIRQIGGDRILSIEFDGEAGPHALVVELMGKHSNAILIDAEQRCIAAAKWVRRDQSKRPIRPNAEYELPPVMDATDRDPRADSRPLGQLREAHGIAAPDEQPGWSEGFGAYPVDLGPLGYPWVPRASLSVALDAAYTHLERHERTERLRSLLLTHLDRGIEARDVALRDLAQARDRADRAAGWQLEAELLLAYQYNIPPGAAVAEVYDYEGALRRISLDPEASVRANAEARFVKAKRAKARRDEVEEQYGRILAVRAELVAHRRAVVAAIQEADLEPLRAEAQRRHWLQTPRAASVGPNSRPEDRPYEGHRIRELLAPGDVTVLYGENAEANDWLTLRVAKANDYWLHVRGNTSAHVVIRTLQRPERIQPAVFEFAAKVAVRNSPLKHANFVPVDITLRKYVRKVRGAPKGTVQYTHERTIHVDGISGG
ncbi:MAG: NFACT family protein [Fimbriimonadaceae bacterium]|nr:NFACT family protein [Fimbriimonadaceae bacterium]